MNATPSFRNFIFIVTKQFFWSQHLNESVLLFTVAEHAGVFAQPFVTIEKIKTIERNRYGSVDNVNEWENDKIRSYNFLNFTCYAYAIEL